MSGGTATEAFFRVHRDNLQEGPGSTSSTQKAFAMIPGLPPNAAVLDAGCGPGRQTLDLCRLTRGPITAVDNHRPYLEALRARSADAGYGDRVRILEGDLSALPFEEATFDLIWSEGAIYNIGFRNGLELWRPLLKPGGWVAVTELTLLRSALPDEVQAFWDEAYPAAQSAAETQNDLRAAGYEPVGQFTLPEEDWWDYYRPIENRLSGLEGEYAADTAALEVLALERREIDLYRTYSDYYGYQFCLGRNHV